MGQHLQLLARWRELVTSFPTKTAFLLDTIYDDIDNLLLAGAFDVVNDMLRAASVESFSPTILGGILTITAQASSSLSERHDFYERVRAHLLRTMDPEEVHGLLDGLEG